MDRAITVARLELAGKLRKWQAKQAEKEAAAEAREAEKLAAEEAKAAARELLKKELGEIESLKDYRATLSQFLSKIPLDALQGTAKRMAGATDSEAVDELREKVESASTEWVFSNRDDEEDDD